MKNFYLKSLFTLLVCILSCATYAQKSDVNKDGVVNTADVVAIYNYIINGGTTDCDINGDGIINTADIVSVYNYIINGPTEEIESGIYVGICGFNQKLTNYPIQLLTENSKSGFEDFIVSLSNNNDGTSVFYALDNSITTLKSNQYPSNLFKTAIVTFTDGIDNYSIEHVDGYTKDQYQTYVHNRLLREKVKDVSIDAYSIGLKSSGVNATTFTKTLESLASSSSNSFEVTNMDEVNEKFKEIAQKIVETSSQQSISLSIPGGLDDGTKVRFTFDLIRQSSMTSDKALLSKHYIEGTYYRQDKQNRYLRDLTCQGLTFKNTGEVHGKFNAETGLVDFLFEEVVTDNKKSIDTTKVFEWWKEAELWQFEEEFHPGENTQLIQTQRSAAIMLVLDCTRSLGSELFGKLKTNSINFLNTLLQKPEGGGGEPIEGIYNNHEYVDLGLPSGLKWATCNIGANKPEEYGNYFEWGDTQPVSGEAKGKFDSYSINDLVNAGVADKNGNLTLPYDAANVNWSGTWRLPTQDECQELIDACEWIEYTLNGVAGKKVIGPNGKSLFLPYSGKIFVSGSVLYDKTFCGIFTSTAAPDSVCQRVDLGYGRYKYHYLGMVFCSSYGDKPSVGDTYRTHCHPIRPVSP